MNNEPKNIWKKSWNGWRGLLLGWALLSGGLIAILLIWLRAEHVPLIRAGDELKLFGCFWGIVTLIFLFIPFVRWLCCWRNVKRTLFGIACFATLIGLFYAEENWRGKHDWEQFKREWEAKGERFDWQSIVPPSVSDDENFAFSPVWIANEKFTFLNTPERARAWYGDRIDSEEVSNILPLLPVSTSTVVGTNMWNFPSPPDGSSTWTSSRFLDLKPFQSYYRNTGETKLAAQIIIAPQPQAPAQDVLLALSKFNPVIERLRQDSVRPDSRFPIQYDNGMPAAILLPHLAAEKRLAQVLQLRAIAELQNNESKKAFGDVKLMLRMTDASRTEAFLISHLVRIAILNLTLQPIYEGLAEHKWSDEQLGELDLELAKLDFFADYESIIRGERNLGIANIEFLRHPSQIPGFKRPRLYFIAPFFSLFSVLSNLSEPENDSQINNCSMLALGVGPSGWLSQNQLRLAQFDIKWYLPFFDKETKTASPAKARAAGDALEREIRHRTPENVLAALMIPGLRSGAVKFAHAQSSTDLARIAIALERYRLAHGEYPESLDALAPQFIAQVPHDVIGGGPLHYRHDPPSSGSGAANRQFVLYSIGWNEQDDGGVVIFKKGSSPDVDLDKGDWVWRYPKAEGRIMNEK